MLVSRLGGRDLPDGSSVSVVNLLPPGTKGRSASADTRAAHTNSNEGGGTDVGRGRSGKTAANSAAAAAAGSRSTAAGAVADGEELVEGSGVYIAERIEGEKWDRSGKQTLFRIKWAKSEVRTWEPWENIASAGEGGKQLYDEYKERCRQQSAAEAAMQSCMDEESKQSAQEDLAYSGTLSDNKLVQAPVDKPSEHNKHISSSNSSKAVLCSKYAKGRFDGKTCGVFQSFDACGYPMVERNQGLIPEQAE